ncbi:uncharacterized protein LOC113566647 [Drosophila persimilis]|uniref:uncharacterized protein LOC113566647 n=1 Tax=Drosophila persimilis TaxID=7234 RepID=UPI000F09A019|nr:uncharacterized protein LOC113566647 [Drosophila persimilis]
MLLNLPLEIVDKLFGYLDEKDQLNFADSHQKLGSALLFHACGRYAELDCSKFTDDELKVILATCGYSVVKINIDLLVGTSVIELVPKYCSQLARAQLCVSNGNITAIKSILSIKDLEFIQIWSPGHVESDILLDINTGCKRLEIFCISNSGVNHLQRLENLEYLTIYSDSSASVNHILEECVHLKKLKTLCVITAEDNTTCSVDHYHDLVYPQVESLTFMFCGLCAVLPSCPKLRSLTLFCNECRNVSIGQIIAKYALTLERLTVQLEGPQINGFPAEVFLEVLGECKNLQSISMGTINVITDVLNGHLDALMNILMANGFNVHRRFLVTTGSSIAHEQMLKLVIVWIRDETRDMRDKSEHFLLQETDYISSEIWNLLSFQLNN